MGIAARSRSYGITVRTYKDDYVRTVDTKSFVSGNTTHSESISSTVAQVLSRSGKSKGQLKTIAGYKRVRLPTDYSLKIYDRPQVLRQRITRASGSLTTITEAFDPDINVVANASGLFGGYYVRHSDDAKNQSITKCLNKLGSQKASLGAALAEARSTYNMLADTSTALFRSYKALRSGNLPLAARSVGLSGRDFFSGKSSAAALLQVKYGWLPLMKDISDGYDFFFKNKSEPLLLSETATATRSFSGSVTYGNGVVGSWTTSHKSTCSIMARLNGDFSRGLNQGGLMNIPAIGWELVPYSFVLDWWMPVGNVLQSYSDTCGLSFVKGFISQRSEAEVSYTGETDKYTSATNYVTYGGPSCLDRMFSFDRTQLTSFPIAGIYQKQNWFDKAKGAQALALFRQLFR